MADEDYDKQLAAQTEGKVIDIFANQIEQDERPIDIDRGNITRSTNISDYRPDGLVWMNLLIEYEDEFGIMLNEQDLSGQNTFGDVIDYLASVIGKKGKSGLY